MKGGIIIQYLLKIVKTVILSTLFLSLFSQTSSAKVLNFEKSGYEYTTDTSMVTFVNSNGLFDGTTDYVEVISSTKNGNKGLKGTLYYLIDLKKPYIKIHKVHLKKKLLKKNNEDTLRIDTDWINVKSDKFNINDELYHEVVNYINQNWQVVYDRSVKQEISVSVNTSSPTTDTTLVEQKQQEPSLPNLSWNGTWETSVGQMQLKQTDDRIQCVINKQKLVGTIMNDKVVGKWSGIKFFSSTEPEGEFQLIMSPDGTFIKIKWKDKWTNWATDSTANRLP